MPYCANCDNPKAGHLTARCPKNVPNTLEGNEEELVKSDCLVCAARKEKEKLRKRRWRKMLKRKAP